MLRDNGIGAHGGIMMGNPKTEGIPQILNNIRYAHKLLRAGLARVAFFPYVMLPGSYMTSEENPALSERYARIRKDYGNVGYGFDTSNVDSFAHGWTAEELITIVEWANQALISTGAANWQEPTLDDIVSVEELEAGLAQFTSANTIYIRTIERLQKEVTATTLIQHYHDAITAIRYA